MNDTPIDVFADLNLEEFKKKPPAKSHTPKEKETIRRVAQESNFQSRDPKPRGIKIIPKTFSLFKEDCDAINSAIQHYLSDPDCGRYQPSGSDVVRAALHHFAKQSPQAQIKQIKEHRGRGYK